MHRFQLELDDLASAAFACSPLQETVLSLRMWTHPGTYHPAQTAWFELIRPEFERLPQAGLLRSLVGSNRWVPDFLTPRPATPSRISAASSRWSGPCRRSGWRPSCPGPTCRTTGGCRRCSRPGSPPTRPRC